MTTTAEETVRGVLRGSLHWSALRSVGIDVRFDRHGARMHDRRLAPVLEVSPADLAAGLLATSADARGLREWASVILAVDCYDFGPLQEHIAGTLLLDAVWDAMSGPVSPTALLAAQQLAVEPGGSD